jgi:hypothetical protein
MRWRWRYFALPSEAGTLSWEFDEMQPHAPLAAIDPCGLCAGPFHRDVVHDASRLPVDQRRGNGDRDGTRTPARTFVWNPRLIAGARWYILYGSMS